MSAANPRRKTLGERGRSTPISFFIMPDIALTSLRDELLILVGETDAGAVLERIGRRCGEGVARDLGEQCRDLDAVMKILPELWMHIGLSNISIESHTDQEFLVAISNSVETVHRQPTKHPDCQFTNGYLAGLVGAMLEKPVQSTECACQLHGDEQCEFRVCVNSSTLEPECEPPAPTEQRHTLDPGHAYLVPDPESKQSFEIFEDYVTHGTRGICVTRAYPDRIRQDYHLHRTPIIWLTQEEGRRNIKPHQLGKLNHVLEDTLRSGGPVIILIDGIEYLITHNTFQSVLKLIQILRDKIAMGDSILLIPISPGTYDAKHLKLLERETVQYSQASEEQSMVESIFSKLQ